MGNFIGIDLGTSSVKLVLTDDQGKVLREAGESYSLLQPRSGWKEIEPDTWWKAVCRALQTLLNEGGGSQVEGIGITGQMHSIIFLDENGVSIRPALMWNDNRTKDLLPGLREQIQSTDVPYIGKIISTGSPAANLLWLKENEPEHFERLEKFLIGPDYLVWRMTGVYGTAYCEASTSSLYDLYKREWSPSMREVIGLPKKIYPEVRGSAEIVGTILPEIADQFGLNPSARVIVGTGDNPAASIPTGCLGCRYPVFSLGTSGVLMLPKYNPDFEAKGKNILFSFDSEHFYTLVQGVLQSCGSGYGWWNQEILGLSDFADADRRIDIERLGEKELLFYPHLTGDKTIYKDPTIRGAFLGLGTDTTRADMTQAVMEGIAFGLKQLVGEMRLARASLANLKVIGGGSRSRVWMQILADVLDSPVEQMEGNAGAGYGMALLAAYSCGATDSLESISKKAVSVKECFTPRSYHADLYEKKYQQYLRIHDAVKSVFG